MKLTLKHVKYHLTYKEGEEVQETEHEDGPSTSTEDYPTNLTDIQEIINTVSKELAEKNTRMKELAIASHNDIYVKQVLSNIN